jgi:DNA-binding FrmR family transcriptional regulator
MKGPTPMQSAAKKSCRQRLTRIEGQVRGVAGMIDGDRYCIDVLTQLQAIRAALKRVEDEVLADHVSHCLDHAIRSGNASEQRKKVQELLDVLERAR